VLIGALSSNIFTTFCALSIEKVVKPVPDIVSLSDWDFLRAGRNNANGAYLTVRSLVVLRLLVRGPESDVRVGFSAGSSVWRMGSV